MKTVYFDNAATTQVRDEVILEISRALSEYGNPSSTHAIGRSSKSILENCRKEIASIFKVSAAEIIFTSGGTEADNLILNSCVRDLKVTRIITSKIEHHAVLHTIEELSLNYDLKVDYVNLDAVSREINEARRLYSKHNWPTINVSRKSIEETAAQIIQLHQRRTEQQD